MINITGIKHYTKTNLFTESQARYVVKIFDEGPFFFRNGSWRNEKDDYIYMHTIEALYERYLVRIVVDAKDRKKIMVELTQIGEHVACDLKLKQLGVSRPAPHEIDEDTAVFIAEVTSL